MEVAGPNPYEDSAEPHDGIVNRSEADKGN